MAKKHKESYIRTLNGEKTVDFEPRLLSQTKPTWFKNGEKRDVLFAYVETLPGGSEYRPLEQFTRLPPLHEIPLFSYSLGGKAVPLGRDHPAVMDAISQQFVSQQIRSEEATEVDLFCEAVYVPGSGDHRQIAHQLIRLRRGQKRFREALRTRYGDRCLVTGCAIVDLLEAAHINPYRSDSDHHPENGLLLRADIHTLFDLDLLGIEPAKLLIELHPAIEVEYGNLVAKPLIRPEGIRPSPEALMIRYRKFITRKNLPA